MQPSPHATYEITIDNTGETFHCDDNVHLLFAMERARCHGIPVGCRNGGCGACKISIRSGTYESRKMNRAVVSAEDEAARCVLACKTYPRSHMLVHALGRVWQPSAPPASSSFSFGFASTSTPHQSDKEN